MPAPLNYLRTELAEAWQGQDPLEVAFSLEGEIFRDVPNRRTLKVNIAGRDYFLKLHYGVGWGEVLKNWLQFKRPVLGADLEYRAFRALAEEGIPAPIAAGYASSAGSTAKRRSFVLSDPLVGYTTLEDVVDEWLKHPPTLRQRRQVLRAVARFAARFHQAGFVHRDFYVCHILLKDDAWAEGRVELAVLDLHRAQQFAQLPPRWRHRDLAAMLFSVLDLNLTPAEWLRFVRIYTGLPLRQALTDPLWRKVKRRARRLYAEGLRKQTVKGLARLEALEP